VLDSLTSHTRSSWAQRRVCRGGQGDPSLRSGWHSWSGFVWLGKRLIWNVLVARPLDPLL